MARKSKKELEKLSEDVELLADFKNSMEATEAEAEKENDAPHGDSGLEQSAEEANSTEESPAEAPLNTKATEESEATEEDVDSEESEAAEDTHEEMREMTEEEIRDARYLPRESVIYDENASDRDEYEPQYDEPEVYSLNFFESEEESEDESLLEEDEPEEKEQEPYNPEKPRKIDARFDFVELFVFTLVFVLVITSFIFRHSVVVGGSMENTLYEGERLLISDLFYTPDYGDIIVFQDASTGIKGAIVKRVIGLPGDVIEIASNGSIYRNGVLLLEEYVFIDGKNHQDNMIFVVPEREYFVMGDHRNNSEDSRSFGTIKEDSILGRVLLRFYPFDRFGKVG